MHEVALALEMLDMAVARAASRKVARVVVEVGVRSCVHAEALRFAFEVAAQDTVAAGAFLDVRAMPALAKCVACGLARETIDVWARCECGSDEIVLEGGEQLRMREIEVE